MSAQKKFQTINVLIHIVIILTISSIALGYNFDDDNGICGKGNSKVNISYKINDTWKQFDESYLIHAQAVLTYAEAVADLQIENLQVSGLSESQEIEYRNVSKVFINPKYEPCNGYKNFAILIFETPFSANYSPICLKYREKIRCSEEEDYFVIISSNQNLTAEKCEKLFTPLSIPEKDITESLCDPTYYEMDYPNVTLKSLGGRRINRVICTVFLDENNVRQFYDGHSRYETWCKYDYHRHFRGSSLHLLSLPWVSEVFDEISEDKLVQ